MRRRLAVEIMIDEMVRRHVNVVQTDIMRYYREHLEDFRQPRQLHLGLIFIKAEGKADNELAEAVEQVAQQLAKGMDFATAAEEYSDDLSAERGGDMGWINVRSGKKEFVKAADKLETGQVAAPLRLPEGTYFIKLFDVKEEQLPALDQALRDKITRQLQMEKQKRRYDEYISQLREKYYVKTFF
jgi:parvulin-like peptidyl-prolyl isomerase